MESLTSFVAEHAPGNLEYLGEGFDTQIEYDNGKQYRVYKEDGSPQGYPMPRESSWTRIGCSGYDIANNLCHYVIFEFDRGHSSNQITEEQREWLIALLSLYCSIVRSTGGEGLHCKVWLSEPLPCASRAEYTRICEAAIRVLVEKVGEDFSPLIESIACILWLASVDQNEDSFRELSSPNYEPLDSNEVLASMEQPLIPSTPCTADAGACMEAMLRIKRPETEQDGSNRLYAVCCRAVEHNLSDSQAIETVRQYSSHKPFPKTWSDDDILKRVRDAEAGNVVRGSAKTRIVVNEGDFIDVYEQMETSIGKNGVYQNNSSLVEITRESLKGKHVKRDTRQLRITPIHQQALIKTLHASADFLKKTKVGYKPCSPPVPIMNALFHAGQYSHVRQLQGIRTAPLLSIDGEVIRDNGYNKESSIFLAINGEYPDLMDTPKALALLTDLYGDFPFNNGSSLSGNIAYILTLIAQHIINGPNPMFVLDGNRPGCGKGLCVDIGSIIAMGKRASLYAGIANNDEMRKFLLTIALSGSASVVFDNVEGLFGGSAIESALTSHEITGRRLGSNSEITAKFNCVFAMTANGAVFRDDMIRRTIQIIIDTDNPQPHLRDDFERPDLLGYVSENRRELYMAALSIVANHLKAGCPPHNKQPMQSFNEWDKIVRAAVINAGLADPYANSISLGNDQTSTDPMITLLQKVWQFDSPTTVQDAVASPALNEFLADHKVGSSSQWLGQLLRRSAGVVIDGRKFTKTHHQKPKWSLV